MKKNIFDALKYLYLAIFLFTGLVLFLGYLTIRSTIRPIHHLISSINQIDENNLVPLDTAHKTNNEVGVLIQAYNKMILRLSESLTRELKYQRAQHQMELEMLQLKLIRIFYIILWG